MRPFGIRLAGAFLLALAAACSRPEVVVYVSADEELAAPILQRLEKDLAMRIQPVFDVEATRTVGLARALIAERSSPRCDVYWNNEIVHTLRLKRAGLLAPYVSPAAASIPAEFKDPDATWTGFAARARVIVVNTKAIAEADRPRSVKDLADPRWKARAGFARPLAGTSLSHAACLFDLWGDDAARAFFEGMVRNDVSLPPGNGLVAEQAADGRIDWGVVDTDDVESQRKLGRPVDGIVPDQEGEGVVVLPNTLSLIAGAPHPENGKRLIDALLDPSVERELAFSPSANIPVRAAVEAPPGVRRLASMRVAKVDFDAVARDLDRRLEILGRIFPK